MDNENLEVHATTLFSKMSEEEYFGPSQKLWCSFFQKQPMAKSHQLLQQKVAS